MTFEQFQATRTWADNLGAVPGMDLGFDEPMAGYHYHGGLHIISHGGGAAPQAFELVIGNVIETSEDLTELERKLYAYGESEGHFD
jgi:hypothetical protein